MKAQHRRGALYIVERFCNMMGQDSTLVVQFVEAKIAKALGMPGEHQ